VIGGVCQSFHHPSNRVGKAHAHRCEVLDRRTSEPASKAATNKYSAHLNKSQPLLFNFREAMLTDNKEI
jgi:hypothetical protein